MSIFHVDHLSVVVQNPHRGDISVQIAGKDRGESDAYIESRIKTTQQYKFSK